MVNAAPTKLVIWDWNGTLLDDAAACFAIANRMRAERGLPTMDTLDEYRGVFGFPVIDYYRRMGYTFERESYEDVSVEFVALYAACVSACPLQPHAREVLGGVRQSGIRQVLLSATGTDKLFEQIRMFRLEPYFDEIIGCENNLAHGKLAQARALIDGSGLAPEQALFVGDTDHDFEIASTIGCRSLLFSGGHHLPAYLQSLGATVIDDLQSVLDAVCAR